MVPTQIPSLLNCRELLGARIEEGSAIFPRGEHTVLSLWSALNTGEQKATATLSTCSLYIIIFIFGNWALILMVASLAFNGWAVFPALIFIFESGSYSVAQASLGFIAIFLLQSCAVITGMNYYAWVQSVCIIHKAKRRDVSWMFGKVEKVKTFWLKGLNFKTECWQWEVFLSDWRRVSKGWVWVPALAWLWRPGLTP